MPSALVTGSTGEIGTAIADRLELDGCTVVCAGRDIHRRASEAVGADILVNCAGHTQRKPWLEVTDDDLLEMWRVHVLLPWQLARLAAPGMAARNWGRIVNVSSISARTGGTLQPHYATAKAGLEGMTRSLARLLGRYGITVNAVAPGLIDTAAARCEVQSFAGQEAIHGQPVPRVGTVADVAGAVAWLCSREAAYVTGQTLAVCGGRVML